MDKEKLTDLVRNILWAVLLIAALIYGIASGHWKAFIILAVLFVSIKSVILLMQLKLRKASKELKETLESQGRPSYVPKPSEIEAMQTKPMPFPTTSRSNAHRSGVFHLPSAKRRTSPPSTASWAAHPIGMSQSPIPPMPTADRWLW